MQLRAKACAACIRPIQPAMQQQKKKKKRGGSQNPSNFIFSNFFPLGRKAPSMAKRATLATDRMKTQRHSASARRAVKGEAA